MLMRKISAELVKRILADPDGSFPQSMDKTVVYKHIDGRNDNLIAVVAVGRMQSVEIVTVMHNFEVRS